MLCVERIWYGEGSGRDGEQAACTSPTPHHSLLLPMSLHVLPGALRINHTPTRGYGPFRSATPHCNMLNMPMTCPSPSTHTQPGHTAIPPFSSTPLSHAVAMWPSPPSPAACRWSARARLWVPPPYSEAELTWPNLTHIRGSRNIISSSPSSLTAKDRQVDLRECCTIPTDARACCTDH